MSDYQSLKLWTRPDHYVGAEWPDYYVGLMRHRDSDALERSNFEVFLRALGGESDTVFVVREGHWAVGWVEWIAIHKDDIKSADAAEEMLNALSDYPVLDDCHLSETEQEEANQVWDQCFDVKDRIAYIRAFRDQFDFHDFRDLMAVVRGEYFIGYPSELLM